MKTKILVLVMACLYLVSCATIFKGNSSKVDFNSDPQGAKILVNGNYMGDTPIRLKLESKKTYNIEFRKEGYKTKTFNITNHVGAGWIVLDVLFGLVPVIVDAATGAWYDLDQKNVNAILEKQNGQTSKRPQRETPKTEKLIETIKKDVVETAETIGEAITKFTKEIKVIIDRAKVRLNPNKNGQVIAVVKFGTVLQAKGKTGDWYIVDVPSTEEGIVISGYIHKFDVK